MSQRQGTPADRNELGRRPGCAPSGSDWEDRKEVEGRQAGVGAAHPPDRTGPGKIGERGKNVLADSRSQAVGYVCEQLACPDRICK